MDTTYTISELADAAGVSRRAVRFYVQEKLLAPPEGAGRGSHYTGGHLEVLRRIAEWQRVGHSLEGIRRLLKGEEVEVPGVVRPVREAALAARLMTRVELMEGVEVAFDAGRFAVSAEGLRDIQEAVKRAMRRTDK